VGLVVSEYLYGALPGVDEGELTRVKSVAVSTRALARCAQTLELQRLVRVNKGISKRGGLPPSILANVFEAVTAAVYLDGGLEEARTFVLQQLTERTAEVLEDRHAQNWKSLLQQVTQRDYSSTPTYRVLREEGPDHRKEFLVAAVIEGVEYEAAVGNSKKDAEQDAARHAWEQIRTAKRVRPKKTRSGRRGKATVDAPAVAPSPLPVKKAPAKKTPPEKKAPVKKAPVKKTAAKKAPVKKKAAAMKTPAPRKAAAAKARRAPAKKTVAAKKKVVRATPKKVKKPAAAKSAAKKVPAASKKRPTTKRSSAKSSAADAET